VIEIEREQNLEVLRQVAVLLDRENHRLHEKLHKLLLENARLKGADAATLQLEIEHLQELLAQRQRQLFGLSSEKRPRTNGEESASEKLSKTGHGPTAQPELPIVEQTHELPETKEACPSCGGDLVPLGEQFEESEEISVVQRQFVVVKHRRRKYRCRCNAAVLTAPAPPKLIAGGRYSPEFAIDVATSKYLDHLPLERQARIMERQGLAVSSQTLWDQIEALARVLDPTYQALHPRVLSAPVVGADETHWALMHQQGGTSRWWVWCVASPEAVFYRLCGTRATKEAQALLAGYRGVVMCDGYTAYETLARAGPRAGPTLAHCWAHVRRKFVEIEQSYPEPSNKVLDWIAKLYQIEREVPRGAASEAEAVVRLRAELRQTRSRPVVEELRSWALAQTPAAGVLPRSGLGRAVAYLLGMWPGLVRFLKDPRIPLDNNGTERALRGVVLGRKNHYGSRSKRGTEVAALFYSLCETAKLAGVEPGSYLLEATRRALAEPGTVTLPHELHS
jgi:transposase